MKVESDRVIILKKGSLTGYFREPHNVVCSRMWATPVLSMGVVRNPTLRGGGGFSAYTEGEGGLVHTLREERGGGLVHTLRGRGV